jgi:hypothetical protein
LTMVGSTVSDNVAIRSIFAGPSAGVGGGASVGGATIRNSTISGNGALIGGGIAVQPNGTVSLFNVTVAANAGTGLLGPGMTLVLRNTIVAGNAGDCSDLDGSGFTTVGDAYNIDSDGTCQLSGTDQPGVDPLLAPLADNGGPTFTHALIVGSPAIDMGSPAAPGSGGTACEATDQRGVVRPVGVRCDVGAFEGSVVTTSTTTSSTTSTTAPPTTTTSSTSTSTTASTTSTSTTTTQAPTTTTTATTSTTTTTLVACFPSGSSCTRNADCCSNSCKRNKGQAGGKVCR